MKEVHVAVSVVWREGRILIARRPEDAHQGGLLEFPGGKIEAGESVARALSRELEEETGLRVSQQDWVPLIGIRHDYGDKRVFLDVWETRKAQGEPEGREGQPLQWLAPGELEDRDFPAANRPIIRSVRLPRMLCITSPDISAPRLGAALQRHGSDLVVLRAPGLGGESYLSLAREALDLCAAAGGGLLVHGSPGLVESLPGVAGVHLSWAEASELGARPVRESCWLGVSCHDAEQLAHAERIGADYVTLGPVRSTPTHPDASLLGWEAFAALVAQSSLPVYALGGVFPEQLAEAMEHGAQGIAGIRFWLEENPTSQEVV